MRNRERPKHKQLPEIRALENPDEEYDVDQHCPDVSESEYLANPSAYRHCCWNVKVILHILYTYLFMGMRKLISGTLSIIWIG